eukprot:gene30579-35597_t
MWCWAVHSFYDASLAQAVAKKASRRIKHFNPTQLSQRRTSLQRDQRAIPTPREAISLMWSLAQLPPQLATALTAAPSAAATAGAATAAIFQSIARLAASLEGSDLSQLSTADQARLLSAITVLLPEAKEAGAVLRQQLKPPSASQSGRRNVMRAGSAFPAWILKPKDGRAGPSGKVDGASLSGLLERLAYEVGEELVEKDPSSISNADLVRLHLQEFSSRGSSTIDEVIKDRPTQVQGTPLDRRPASSVAEVMTDRPTQVQGTPLDQKPASSSAHDPASPSHRQAGEVLQPQIGVEIPEGSRSNPLNLLQTAIKRKVMD